MNKIFLIVVFLLSCTRLWGQDEYVVLVSMDGFRWDYPSMYRTPNLTKIAKQGVHAQSLKPCFPSKTFPNHYSMATGLYPDHHGIVNNSFFAPEYGEPYSMSGKMKNDARFYGGDPIWNVLERNGIRTASFYWVGSEVAVNGHHPSIWKNYDGNVPFSARIDSVVKWLQLPIGQRPRFVTLYFQEPDGVSHNTGPYSHSTQAVVEQLDSLIGVLNHKLTQLPIGKKINLIIVSDHGMGEISNDRVVELSSILKQEWLEEVQGGNPMMNLKAKANCYDSVYNALSQMQHAKAWKNTEVPERLHYGTNQRTLDFSVVADSLWSLTWKRKNKAHEFDGGTHGYDPEFKQVQGIFYAKGPALKRGKEVPSFDNLNVFNIVARILGIQPPANDGDPRVLGWVLR